MSLWIVYVLGATIDPGRQLDFVANGVVTGQPVQPVAAGDRLEIIFPTNTRTGGIVINADPDNGVMELDGGARYSIRKAKPTDNMMRLGTHSSPWEAWFVGAKLP